MADPGNYLTLEEVLEQYGNEAAIFVVEKQLWSKLSGETVERATLVERAVLEKALAQDAESRLKEPHEEVEPLSLAALERAVQYLKGQAPPIHHGFLADFGSPISSVVSHEVYEACDPVEAASFPKDTESFLPGGRLWKP